MSEPRPWREAPADVPAEVARVVALAASVPPTPIDRAAWDDVLARAAAPRHDWRLVPAFVLSVLAGVALVLVVRPTPAPAPVVAHAAPVITPAPGASFSHEPAERIALRSGRLSVAVPTGGAVNVVTPHLELDVQRGRFLADVTESGTLVSVEEGEVVVRTPEGTRVLRAGESALWPPTPDIPQALLGQPAEAPSCAAAQGDAKLDCLSREASRDGLDAQAALYELGTLQLGAGDRRAAERTFRASLERFPRGVLHPEVRLSLLVELVRARRFAEAIAVARDFEAACADDPRASDVAALRRALEPRHAP